MIPILYESTETAFTTNGIGALTDCISCLVTEERNGQYEVEFTYPITGIRYSEILEGRIVCVTHDEQKDAQPFIIYGRSAPMDGIVTFTGHHYSYLLSGIAVSPFTASSVADAFSQISSHSMNTNPFTFWTDNTTAGTMSLDTPASARAVLGGVRGSILDVFGGEYEFDKLTVKNYAHRGTDNGVTIRYGKNLTDISQTIDAEFLYNAAVPFWKGTDGTVVYGSVTAATGQTAKQVTVMDLSSEFENQPSAAQLQTAAKAKLDSGQPWIPKENIEIDFVALWQTEEYKDIALLERVQLCDTVTIYYPELGVNATAKVIRVVWDALLDRYDTIELGSAKSSFSDTILSDTYTKLTEISDTINKMPTTSMMDAAIDHATELITGGLGGYVVINTDANGKPTEILIMDTADTSTAVNVWRFNSGGLGHSHSGYNGPYNDVALTQDGQINANMITTGTLLANMIYGGTLTLGGSGNGNGILVVKNASGTEIGRWNNTGVSISKGSLTTTSNDDHTVTKVSAGVIDTQQAIYDALNPQTLLATYRTLIDGGTILGQVKTGSSWVTKAKIDLINSNTELPGNLSVGGTITNGIPMWKTVQKSVSVSIPANSNLNVLANTDPNDILAPAFDIGTQSGYSPVAAVKVTTGNNNVVVRSFNAEATGTTSMVMVRNVSSSSASATVTIEVLYLNNTYKAS